MSKHQICVNKVPADRTNFIKTLRLAGRLELKQALDLTVHLVRYGHSILVAGIDLPVAEHLAEALRETGAEVDVQVSSIQTPCYASRKSMPGTCGEHSAAFARQADSADAVLAAIAPAGPRTEVRLVEKSPGRRHSKAGCVDHPRR